MDVTSLIGAPYASNSITMQETTNGCVDHFFKVFQSGKQCGFLVAGQTHCLWYTIISYKHQWKWSCCWQDLLRSTLDKENEGWGEVWLMTSSKITPGLSKRDMCGTTRDHPTIRFDISIKLSAPHNTRLGYPIGYIYISTIGYIYIPTYFYLSFTHVHLNYRYTNIYYTHALLLFCDRSDYDGNYVRTQGWYSFKKCRFWANFSMFTQCSHIKWGNNV